MVMIKRPRIGWSVFYDTKCKVKENLMGINSEIIKPGIYDCTVQGNNIISIYTDKGINSFVISNKIEILKG
jgi:hypothetical protein